MNPYSNNILYCNFDDDMPPTPHNTPPYFLKDDNKPYTYYSNTFETIPVTAIPMHYEQDNSEDMLFPLGGRKETTEDKIGLCAYVSGLTCCFTACCYLMFY